MNREANPMYYPPDTESKVNKEKKNVYHGKLSLQPLTKDKGTIKLKITSLQKLIHNSSNRNAIRDDTKTEYKFGEWNFKIPVTKHPSIQYALNKETKVAGIPVRFEKLIVAPTTTILQYGIKNEQAAKQIESLNFDHLEVNHKKVKTNRYVGSFFVNPQQDTNWSNFQMNFAPLFGVKPKGVNVQLASVNLMIENRKTVVLDASKGHPQTFEYAGSTISIDKVEAGQPAKVVLSNHEIKNRVYESLNFTIVGEDEKVPNSMEMVGEGVLVDKNGVEYKTSSLNSYEKIKQPRYFITVLNIELRSDNADEKVIPKKLEINGYSTTKYLNDVVKISVK